MNATIRRRTTEKELRLAEGYVLTREEYEEQGAKYMGSLGMAAKAGYYTPRGCERLGAPVTEGELANIKHFAVFMDCYQDQTIKGEDGHAHRPCLPVFYREAPREPRHREG